jgi:DNA-binding NarL/FixJ family response regulator
MPVAVESNSSPAAARAASILLVDDHPAMREALSAVIARNHPDLAVCGEASSEEDAFDQVARALPDVVVVDITLKQGNGLDLTKRIKAGYPQVRVLICSAHDPELYAERALRAGALGYISKEHGTAEIITAVRQVNSGEFYLSQPLTQSLLGRLVGGGDADSAAATVDGLSDRELEVFQFLGEGLEMNRIAERMGLSVKTVETYRSRIRQKLNIGNRTELLRFAIEWSMSRRMKSGK